MNKIAIFHYINDTTICTIQQFSRFGGINQQSTQHNNQAGVGIQQSSGGDEINLIIIIIIDIHILLPLFHHTTVGLCVSDQ